MSSGELRAALAGLPEIQHENLLVGFEHSDDAGVFKLDQRTALVQTVDFFTPIVDDPFQFGQIAAANALSDVYAMGGRPLTALNIVCFPKTKLPIEVLIDILKGGSERIKAAGAVLVGGHTVEDDQLKYGLAVTGTISPDEIKSNNRAKPDDVLILTKPIGTGIIATANKFGGADPSDVEEIYQSMIQLNDRGAECMVRHNAHAATDITGFGLIGHALEMALASDVNIILKNSNVPLFASTLRYGANVKFLTKADRSNREAAAGRLSISTGIDEILIRAFFDPQTSGGLLIAIEGENADRLLQDLRKSGYGKSAVVGQVTKGNGKVVIE